MATLAARLEPLKSTVATVKGIEMRFYPLVYRLISLISLILYSLALPVMTIATAAFKLDFLDARTRLSLDRLRHPAVLPALRSRAVAFVARALTHDHYGAGHFDPGRQFA
jgi:hypothetical protein